MHRITPRDAAGRSFHGAARATIDKVDDEKLMQEMAGPAFQGDKRKGVERVQNYGFTSAILPRDQQSGNQSKGTSEFGEASRGKSAEAVMVAMAGNRSHPVAVAIDDRRHRLQKLRDGEVAIFDDLTHQIHLTREGIVTSVPNGKKSAVRVMKSGEKVRNQKGGSDGHGQAPWREKAPYADHEIDKDHRRVRHPKAVAHQVVEEGNLDTVKHYSQITKDGGVKHAADSEAHSITLKDGVSTTSSMAITDTAPAIGHAGPTSVTGTLGVTAGVTAGGYTTVSDRRVKEDIQPTAFGLNELLSVNVVEFNLIADEQKRRVQGFIAQDVARTLPGAVSAGGHPEDAELLSIDTGQLLALAVQAIKDLHGQVAALRSELSSLRWT